MSDVHFYDDDVRTLHERIPCHFYDHGHGDAVTTVTDDPDEVTCLDCRDFLGRTRKL